MLLHEVLICAVWMRNTLGIQAALQAGADPRMWDGAGGTALSLAVAMGNSRPTIQMLLADNTATSDMPCEHTATSGSAVRRKQPGLVGVLLMHEPHLLDRCPFGGWSTPLIWASRNGWADIVGVLLGSGAIVGLASGNGTTALMASATAGHRDIVATLLAHGANPNQSKGNGWTALMLAAKEGGDSVVETLLVGGADPNQATGREDTALMVSAMAGHHNIVATLLAHGADPNQSKEKGCTALMLAAQDGEDSVVKALLVGGADPNQATDRDDTALMLAAEAGEGSVVETLLAGGADPNHAAVDGDTALMLAAQEGRLSIAHSLLARFADPNSVTTDDGVTAMMLATIDGHVDMVALLLAYGGDIDIVDDLDDTVMDKARRNNHPAMVDCLDTIGGWSRFKISAACRLHRAALSMLRSCEIDPRVCTLAEITTVLELPAHTMWRGSPAPCRATDAVIMGALLAWTPTRHQLYGPAFRAGIRAVLFTAARHHRTAAPSLPAELWLIVCSFLLR